MLLSVKRLLMVYPKFPKAYWGMHHWVAMRGKKATMPPLGLITIASLTPAEYEIRLIDLNTQIMTDEDLGWAEIICFSAMLMQKESLFDVAERCRKRGKLVVFGGPYPTSSPEECTSYCDVLVLDEGEMTWPIFLEDLKHGHYQKVYRSLEKPDVTKTPVPRFDLLNVRDYLGMSIQFSRGCPFQCEFCDITTLFGRRPRTKTPEQVLGELEALYKTGYRGFVFIVDDNFIGNKKEAKNLLPKLKVWNESRNYPFFYGTEASVNLSDDKDLLKGMVDSLFMWVFVGLESPNQESLKETKKLQNIGGSLLGRVRVIQSAGLMVWGGFIIGFDHDQEDIFNRQIDFIQQAEIPNASVGLLYALPGTPLYSRMIREGRLDFARAQEYSTASGTANHFDSGFTNIVTVIPREKLKKGYYDIMRTIFMPENYFNRALEGLCCQPSPKSPIEKIKRGVWLGKILSKNCFVKSTLFRNYITTFFVQLKVLHNGFSELPVEFKMGAKKFFWQVLRRCPHQIPWVLPYICMGAHYYRFTFENVLPKDSKFNRDELSEKIRSFSIDD